MATIISHPLIPLTLGVVINLCSQHRKISISLIALGMVCAIFPDVDVIGFKWGVAYASDFGHRGFTHSIFLATVLGLGATLLSKPLATSRLCLFLFVSFSTLSHGLLDALTTGGLGIAFFWPLESSRYFFPWRFIEVSPIGMNRFFSARGWRVMQSELLTIWLPCLFIYLFTYSFKKLWRTR